MPFILKSSHKGSGTSGETTSATGGETRTPWRVLRRVRLARRLSALRVSRFELQRKREREETVSHIYGHTMSGTPARSHARGKGTS